MGTIKLDIHANKAHHKSKHVTGEKQLCAGAKREAPREKHTHGTTLTLRPARRESRDGGANGTGAAVTSPIPP